MKKIKNLLKTNIKKYYDNLAYKKIHYLLSKKKKKKKKKRLKIVS